MGHLFLVIKKIYALKAEALLKLNRHQEADEVLTKGPNFSVDESTKFFGPIGQASLLVIRAQVDMAAGRLVTDLLCTIICFAIILNFQSDNDMRLGTNCISSQSIW